MNHLKLKIIFCVLFLAFVLPATSLRAERRVTTLQDALSSSSKAGTKDQKSFHDRSREDRRDVFQRRHEGNKIEREEGKLAEPEVYNIESPKMYLREEKPYLIGRDDILEIAVLDSPDLTKEATVKFDGTIDYTFLGALPAAGRTLEGLADDVRRKLLQGYHKDPQVTVRVTEYNSKKILVFGQVQRPGLYKLKSEIPLLELLFLVGGVQSEAKRMTVIRRKEQMEEMIPAGLIPASVPNAHDEKTEVQEVNLVALLSQGDLSQNIMIQPGDTLYVSSGTGQRFYVLGQVKNPGPYEWVQPITVLEAIKIASGPTEQAALNRIRIRKKVNGQEVEVKINTIHIMQGKKQEDEVVEPGSIIIVPRSWV